MLGDLPESEAELIERWYFADGRAVDEVWAAFSEIAKERLSGALSESEARRFDQRLRSSPALREMFEDEKALCDYAAGLSGGASRQANSEAPVSDGRPRLRFPVALLKPPRLAVAGLVALIVVGLWAALKTPENRNPEGMQSAQAPDRQVSETGLQASVALQQPPQSGRDANGGTVEEKTKAHSTQRRSPPSTEANKTATFLLLASATRGEEGHQTLTIPAGVQTVLLEIETPTDDCAAFSAILKTESGEELQQWKRLRAQRAHSTMRVARLDIAADALKNGHYSIRLECAPPFNSTAPATEYRFSAQKN